jgi:hypothetical protein
MGQFEACYECGQRWGVTMEPRERVLCTPCARPKPWKDPVRYWQSRIWGQCPAGYAGSPEWWDAKTTMQDLRVAVAFAEQDTPVVAVLAVA